MWDPPPVELLVDLCVFDCTIERVRMKVRERMIRCVCTSTAASHVALQQPKKQAAYAGAGWRPQVWKRAEEEEGTEAEPQHEENEWGIEVGPISCLGLYHA